jgi:hypothetical protein
MLMPVEQGLTRLVVDAVIPPEAPEFLSRPRRR